MKISDLLKLSFDNLKRRKGRTALTVLGVVIGTCSIVMMVSIGVAINKNQEDMMQNMGDLTKIDVYNWNRDNPDQAPITDDVIEKFAKLEGVKLTTSVYESNVMQLRLTVGASDKYILDLWGGYNIMGISREAMAEYGYELKSGKFPTAKDKAYSVVVGEMTAYQFQNPKKQWPHNMIQAIPDENGELPKPFVDLRKDKVTLKTNGQGDTNIKNIEKQINIVGTVVQDNNRGPETIGGIIMDIKELQAIEKEYAKLNKIKLPVDKKTKKPVYNRAIIKATDVKAVDGIMKAVEEMGYTPQSPTSWRNEMKKQTRIIQLILAGLGSISLLVAAIGIANTMTMAIYERTKEIGVMKVLGCELRDIKNMFLTEAAGIGFMGGIVGIVISYALSFLLNKIGSSMMGGFGGQAYISIIPFWLAGAGLAFSTFVGIISGYLPANRAVKITALTAIKHE